MCTKLSLAALGEKAGLRKLVTIDKQCSSKFTSMIFIYIVSYHHSSKVPMITEAQYSMYHRQRKQDKDKPPKPWWSIVPKPGRFIDPEIPEKQSMLHLDKAGRSEKKSERKMDEIDCESASCKYTMIIDQLAH